MKDPAEGWFDQGDGTERYWDGTAWTELTRPVNSDGQDERLPDPPWIPAPAIGALRHVSWTWVIVATSVVSGLVLVAAVVVPWVVNSIISTAQAPGQAIAEYADAIAEGDCEAYLDITTARMRELERRATCDDFQQSLQEADGRPSFTIGVATVSGSHADVEVTLDYGQGERSQDVTLKLIKVDGEWKVDSLGMT